MNKSFALFLAALGAATVSQVQADTVIADWTFETSIPATAGPFNPEIGLGSASGSHAGATVYSSPVGNGSSHSFSSTVWAIGDFYQIQFSTVGLSGIFLNFDQVSSASGPGKFLIETSTDGTIFTPFGSDYNLFVNAAPNAWSGTPANHITTTTFNLDLSSVTAINNQASVFIRFVDDSAQSASQVNGGSTVPAPAGTDRMDNIIVVVPEPSTLSLLALGGVSALGVALRRKK